MPEGETIQKCIIFPMPLFNELSRVGKERRLTFSAVIREACIEYLEKKTPGLCQRCHHQNSFEAWYCSKCGNALTEEAARETKEAEDMILNSPEYKMIHDKLLHEIELELSQVFKKNMDE